MQRITTLSRGNELRYCEAKVVQQFNTLYFCVMSMAQTMRAIHDKI